MGQCFLLRLYEIIRQKLHDNTVINSFQDSHVHQSMSHSIPLVAFDFDHTLLGNNLKIIIVFPYLLLTIKTIKYYAFILDFFDIHLQAY